MADSRRTPLVLLYEPASRISKNHTTRLVAQDLGLAQGQGEVAKCEGGALGKVGGLRHVNEWHPEEGCPEDPIPGVVSE